MYIREIELKNFRNYTEEKLIFHKKVNFILGENAQGKTNLLEGIYLSSFGRSFRFGKDNEMIRIGEDFCSIKVTAVKGDGETKVDIIIGIKAKGVNIDNVKLKKTSELLENILIVIFSPEDLKIVKGDPDKRRRFIDRELSQIRPSYYSDISFYRRVLAQRNALLKDKNSGIRDFDIWNIKMADYGTGVIIKRKDFIEKINKISGEIHKNITNGKEKLDVFYVSDILEEAAGDSGDIREKFIEKLEKGIKNDKFTGSTGTGPHRDDLKLIINGMDIRKYGSQGQQRSAAISLKLAEIQLIKDETGEEPILLLDDVLSELDYERQDYLINSLCENQVFITATEISAELMKKMPSGFKFNVKNGTAKKHVMPL